MTKFRFSGVRALDGIGHNFLNGVAVKLTNKVLGRTARAAAIDGKKITAVIKGAGLASALNRMLSGENRGRTGYQEPSKATPAPTPSPSPRPSPRPAPSVSPKAFNAALAA
ncbi:hypothetical protein ACFT1B_08855 [Streptomyces griseoincarnatus]